MTYEWRIFCIEILVVFILHRVLWNRDSMKSDRGWHVLVCQISAWVEKSKTWVCTKHFYFWPWKHLHCYKRHKYTIVFTYLNYSNVHLHFPGLTLSLLPPCFQPIAPSPSLQKASRSNPCPHFSKCIQNDVMLVHRCLTSFRQKKTIVYF